MAVEGRKKGLFDFSNIVAFGHSELWWPQAVKRTTKLAKISPNGNTEWWCHISQGDPKLGNPLPTLIYTAY